MYKILLQQFIKQFGRVPSALEKILLKQKATKQALDQRKVLDLKGNPIDPSKPIIGGKNVKLTNKEKIDWLVKNVDPKAEQTIPPKATLEAMLKDGREDLIEHFYKMHTKKIGSKPQIKIDTSDLKHPELVAGIMRATKPKPNVVKTEAQIKKEIEKRNKESIQRFKDKMKDPEDLAGGGVAGMLGEPTYQDDNHRVPLKGGKTPFKPPLPNENWMESWWKNLGPWEKISVFSWGLPFEKGGRVPMWMGGGLKVGKALLRDMLIYFSKGSKHGKSPTDLLKMINPKQFNEMLNRPGGIPALAKEMIEKYIKTMKKDRADTVEDIISSAKNIKKADDAVIAHKKWMVDDLVKKGSDRKTAEMFAEGMSKAMAKAGPKNAPKITEQGLLELQNIHKNLVTKGRPLNAKGGLAKMLGE